MYKKNHENSKISTLLGMLPEMCVRNGTYIYYKCNTYLNEKIVLKLTERTDAMSMCVCRLG